jgi:hypothetical protein
MLDRGPGYKDTLQDETDAAMRGGGFSTSSFYAPKMPEDALAIGTELLTRDLKPDYVATDKDKSKLSTTEELFISCGIVAASGIGITPHLQKSWLAARNADNSAFGGHERDDAERVAAKDCRKAVASYISRPGIQKIVFPLNKAP